MEVKTIVDECLELWRDPYPQMARLREEGERLVGVLCSYTPEEVLHAAGLTPVRLMGAMRSLTHADAHLQVYCCSLARTDLDMALAGELDFLEGAVFVQTCDTMMRLSDIWRRNTAFQYHGDLVLPIRMGEEVSLPFLVEEVRRFRRGVEEFTGQEIWDDALVESIHVYNRNRRLADRLYRARASNPTALDGLSAMSCLVAGFWMRREKHNELLHEILEGIEDSGEATGGEKVPLLVSGSVCTMPDLYELLLELGADVIDDDLCCGHRYFDAYVDESAPPDEALAKRMWERVNCPAKHQCIEDRFERLVRQVRDSGAKGVVFYLQSFCEPHLFDIPYLRQRLQDELEVPSLVLESELQSFSRGQLRTRLQAFIETISGV
ncbi:MAG: 2-hydroxyacyl-CoA dehydratase [Actinobacteria bacterium]|nr:2-hydroxyacyl-CoA dehydratase [Actinomycetota bacterium]